MVLQYEMLGVRVGGRGETVGGIETVDVVMTHVRQLLEGGRRGRGRGREGGREGGRCE